MSLVFLALLGCDHTGFAFRPEVSDAPAVSDLGQILPLNLDDWTLSGRDAAAFPDSIIYSEVGADENPGNVTGATAHFTGTGGNVCLVVDPEAVYWARSLATSGAGRYKFDDDYTDDGDIDMDAGLTAFYTGSPGVEMGDFKATYSDEAGVDHEIEFNECVQTGYGGSGDVHAGRATVEECVINTDQHAGVEYTVALRTFALPLNDSRLGFAVGAFDVGTGKCDSIYSDETHTADVDNPECLFENEGTLGAENDRTGIEDAFCQGISAVNSYCELHVADENPPCNEPKQTYDPGTGGSDTGG